MSPKDIRHEEEATFKFTGGRLNRIESALVNKIICKRMAEGKTIQEIGDEIGMTRATIRARIARIMDADVPPPIHLCHPYEWLHYRLKRDGSEIGSIKSLIAALGTDIVLWLFDTIPEGLTLAEYVAVIVKDFHEIEMDGGAA